MRLSLTEELVRLERNSSTLSSADVPSLHVLNLNNPPAAMKHMPGRFTDYSCSGTCLRQL